MEEAGKCLRAGAEETLKHLVASPTPRQLLPALLVACATQHPGEVPGLWEAIAPWRWHTDHCEIAFLVCQSLPVVLPFLPEAKRLEARQALLERLQHLHEDGLRLLLEAAAPAEFGHQGVRSFVAPVAEQCLRGPLGGTLGPDELLLAIKAFGVVRILTDFWARVEALQEANMFNLTQIASLFQVCSQEPSIRTRNRNRRDEIPLGARVVQLFSNYICERIAELSPVDITSLSVSLVAGSLPMDEFMLFMLAKRVQDTAAEFNAKQITKIAEMYASKGLEDDEFFTALVESVVSRPDDFSNAQKVDLLHSCGKLRFLHEEFQTLALSPFEDMAQLEGVSWTVVTQAMAAAAMLDSRSFGHSSCCSRLRSLPEDGTSANWEGSWDNFVLSALVFYGPAATRALLPQFFALCNTQFSGRQRGGGSGRMNFRELLMLHRRISLAGLFAAHGLPGQNAWPLELLRQLSFTLRLADSSIDSDRNHKMRRIRDSYDPSSSSFHLEVVAVLKLIDVEHVLEHKQTPFHLDVAIMGEQLERMYETLAAALSSEGRPPAASIASPEGTFDIVDF